MQLDDYFDFLSPTDIRIKGHRIGIDTVLYYYLEGYTAEEISSNFPTLSQEEIYATITYYLHNRTQTDTYLAALETWREEHHQELLKNLTPVGQRLRILKKAKMRQAS